MFNFTLFFFGGGWGGGVVKARCGKYKKRFILKLFQFNWSQLYFILGICS